MSLLAHYPCNDNLATTQVLDASGNAIHCTANKNTNLLQQVARPSGGFRMDETVPDYFGVAGPVFETITTVASFCLGVKIDAWADAYQGQMIVKRSASVQCWLVESWRSGLNEAQVRFEVRQSDATPIRPISNNFTHDQWHYVVCIADGSFAYIYVDGILSGTPLAYDGTIRSNAAAQFAVGYFNTQRFRGDIADVRICDSVLTPWEIEKLTQEFMLSRKESK